MGLGLIASKVGEGTGSGIDSGEGFYPPGKGRTALKVSSQAMAEHTVTVTDTATVRVRVQGYGEG